MCGIVFEGDGVVDLTIIHLTRSADTHSVQKRQINYSCVNEMP